MNRRFLMTAILALTAPLASAQVTNWIPDAAHSEVDFTVLHMSISRVHGRFGKVSGAVQLNAGDLQKSSVQITIDLAGIDTGVAARDNDLRSANFFDVSKYPTASFTSTSVARNGNGLTVAGNLTLHGVTKPVTLNVDPPVGPVNGMGNKQHMGYSATTTISRSEFGIGDKYPNAVLSDAAQLTIDLDVVKQN